MKSLTITAWIISLYLLYPALLSGQQWQKITANLQEQMSISPGGTHKAYLLLSDRVDIRRFESALNANNVPLDDRPPLLIEALQRKAAATQPSLLRQLESMDGIRKDKTQAFWITNVVFLEATNEALLQLSENPSIAEIGFNAPVQNVKTSAAATPGMAPTSNGNTEIGLRVIGAPEMWAMGYTGYGTRAMINDTGVDPAHPALFRQYAYHVVPRDQAWNGETEADCDGHGTHVAGTMLGLDYLQRDTIGVAFEAKWIGGIGLSGDCENGEDVAGTIGMFEYALNPDGDILTVNDIPHVINNSWRTNSSCGNQVFPDLSDAMATAGIAVVFAAGNEGSAPESVTFPGNFNWSLARIFSVGNVNGNLSALPLNSSSSRGPSTCGGEGSVLIKPEVSAPGTTVRSAYLNGGYANLSGTSMAAPHVSGAVLLLKEAFPYLAGEELLLALYYAATDMGEPGEDNGYGMGIINIPAAFDYLVGQGHDPVPPRSYQGNIRLLDITANFFQCRGEIQADALIVYEGAEPLQSAKFQFYIDGESAGTYEWAGNLSSGEAAVIPLPAISAPTGEREVTVRILEANGTEDERPEDQVLKRSFLVVSTMPTAAFAESGPPCENSPLTLRANVPAGARLSWWDAEASGNQIGEGGVLLLPEATSAETLYAETEYIRNVGPPPLEPGEMAYNASSWGLIFDAYQSFTLRSVVAVADAAGGAAIKLQRPDGSSSTRFVFFESAGPQRIVLGWNIERGAGYSIRYRVQGPKLGYLLGQDVAFPTQLEDVVTIRTSTVGSSLYPYFFDWEISYLNACGRSPVTVGPYLEGVSANAPPLWASADTIYLSGGGQAVFGSSLAGAVSWEWNMGDGTIRQGISVTHYYTEPGVYTVSLNARRPEGCTVANTHTIWVKEQKLVNTASADRQSSRQLHVFPNPVQDQLQIELDSPIRTRKLTVLNVNGQRLYERSHELGGASAVQLSTVSWPEGIYLLLIEGERGYWSKRIVKVR